MSSQIYPLVTLSIYTGDRCIFRWSVGWVIHICILGWHMCVYRCIFICICKYRCIRGMSYMYMTLSVHTGVYQDVKCIWIYTDISVGWVTCIPGRHYPYIQVYIKMYLYIYRCIRGMGVYTDVSLGDSIRAHSSPRYRAPGKWDFSLADSLHSEPVLW